MATKPPGSKKYLQLLAFLVAFVGMAFCGNVLVWPTEASHWLNIKIVIQELIRRGHGVTILVSNASLFIKPRAEAVEKFEVYGVPFKKDIIENLIEDIVALWLNNRPTTLTFWQFYKELGKLSINWNQLNRQMCDAVLTNRELMARLRGANYDLLLSDPVTLCGDLVALKLAVPFVYSLRFTPASTVERHCGKIPAPPSYAPAVLSELTDRMSFGERIKNIVSYHLQDYVFQSYWGEWDKYYSKVLGLDKHTKLLSHPQQSRCLSLSPDNQAYTIACAFIRGGLGKDALDTTEAEAKALQDSPLWQTMSNRAGQQPSDDFFGTVRRAYIVS